VDGSLKSLDRAEKAADVDDDETPSETVEEAEELSYRRNFRAGVLDAVTTGALTDEEHKRAAAQVCSLGGLFILGTERHESRRIDNQLRGRSGRQGDPGESRFFVSLEDELWRLFGDKANHPWLRTWEPNLAMDNKFLSAMIQNAQKKVEAHYFDSRKHVLNYDDVMNRQRELIYRERRRILEGEDLKETILIYVTQTVSAVVDIHTPADKSQAEWEYEEMFRDLDEFFALTPVLTSEDLRGKSRAELTEFITEHAKNVYKSKEEMFNELQGDGTMRDLERWMALRAVNARWMEHLANMDYLREGINLRGYEQKDPLLIYQKEAFDEFERMQQAIQDDIVKGIFHVQIVHEEAPPPTQTSLPPGLPRYTPMQDLDEPRNMTTNLDAGNGNDLKGPRQSGAPADWKGGRNDPCWCGSGQKFKKCHGK
jgi:preprotein translocase subunit SecA